jgi:hypothetical protein
LLTVFVVSAARIGTTASCASTRPAATSAATPIAAACVSAKPANAAATVMPPVPATSDATVASSVTALMISASSTAARRSKARPRCSGAPDGDATPRERSAMTPA